MTKITGLSCVMAAMLCLSAGITIAEDNVEAQQAKPAVTNNSESQSNPKEKTTNTNSAQSSTTEAKEEPDCN